MNHPTANLRPLSLAWLTVAGAHPLEQIDAAARAGFDSVGLRILSPPGGGSMVPMIGDPALVRETRRCLDAAGLEVLDVETLWIAPAFDPPGVRPALEVAASLGARNLLVMGHDPDAHRLADHLGALCETARGHGIGIGIEFAAYTDIPDLAAALALLRAAGDPPNASILLDALHFDRSGGTPVDLDARVRGRIGYCQLADARGPRPTESAALRDEARGNRVLPGEGTLPLTALLRALPADLPVAVECPSAALAVLPYAERARLAGDAARRLFEEALR